MQYGFDIVYADDLSEQEILKSVQPGAFTSAPDPG